MGKDFVLIEGGIITSTCGGRGGDALSCDLFNEGGDVVLCLFQIAVLQLVFKGKVFDLLLKGGVLVNKGTALL